MNKLITLLSLVMFAPLALAVSLGDTLNNTIAAQTNTSTSTTKLVASTSKTSTFVETSNHGQIKFMVNKDTNQVYSMTWEDQKGVNLKNILGNTYYPEFVTAAKTPKMHIPRRAISVDDGNLSVSQFGTMASGTQGTATVRSLAPQK